MKAQLFAAAAVAIGALFAGEAQAVPVCTGTTQTVGNGGSVTAAFLLTAGNCVNAGDKTFGNFAVSGALTGTGSASFSFPSLQGNVTLGFSGTVAPSSVGSLVYDVAINPALAGGFLIDDLEKDFTLNASLTGLPASATLTGFTTPASIAFSCTRTVNPSASTCPQTAVFGTTADLIVNETITTGANAIVTALTDTISQTAPVPEPGSLALLGSALVAFSLFWRRYRAG